MSTGTRSAVAAACTSDFCQAPSWVGSRARASLGTPIRGLPDDTGRCGTRRAYGSAGSYAAITSYTARATDTFRAKTVTQSRLRQAGTTPEVDTSPRD